MPPAKHRVQKTRSSQNGSRTQKREGPVTPVNKATITSNAARRSRSISLSSAPDMADIPLYESPPRTPPRTQQSRQIAVPLAQMPAQVPMIQYHQSLRNLRIAREEIKALRGSIRDLNRERRVQDQALNAERERSAQDQATIRREEPAVTVQEGLPRFYSYDIDARLLPLTEKWPAINPEYFQQILDNRFKPENLSKLSNDFSTSCRSVKRQIGNRLVNVEDDADISAIENEDQLISHFRRYHMILTHITSTQTASLRTRLFTALSIYWNYLEELCTRFTFESVRALHLAFHKKMTILGIDKPENWEKRDSTMEEMYLKEIGAH